MTDQDMTHRKNAEQHASRSDWSGSEVCVLASSKPWHREVFELEGRLPGVTWVWVASPDELDRVLSRQQSVRYVFFLHWHWRVADNVWQRFECVCFHMTDVPFGRGGSPLQNLILRGCKDTVMTALQMDAGMDTGPVYAKRPMSLAGRAEEIYRRAAQLSFEMIEWMMINRPAPVPQQGTPVEFKRRTPDQSELPSHGQLADLQDFIRMLDAPTYPKAFLIHGDFVLEFEEASLTGDDIAARVRIRKRRDMEK